MKIYTNELPASCPECILNVRGAEVRDFCDDHECHSPECTVVAYNYHCQLDESIRNTVTRPTGCPLRKEVLCEHDYRLVIVLSTKGRAELIKCSKCGEVVRYAELRYVYEDLEHYFVEIPDTVLLGDAANRKAGE